jgi:hypothetical protein
VQGWLLARHSLASGRVNATATKLCAQARC